MHDEHTNTTQQSHCPLIGEHPADTLSHIQATLTFIQEFAARSTEEPTITPYEIRVNTGLYAILKAVNDAIDYEIERLADDKD
ncbi:MAG: hypothetical protein ACRBCI_07500 [Cellvibrionaceae bacterium]